MSAKRALARRLPGAASAEVQLAMLEAYKDVVAQEGTRTLNRITRSAKEQPRRELRNALRLHWSRERAVLDKERAAAEAELERAFSVLADGLPALRTEEEIRRGADGPPRDAFAVACRSALLDARAAGSSRADEGEVLFTAIQSTRRRCRELAHPQPHRSGAAETLKGALDDLRHHVDASLGALDEQLAVLGATGGVEPEDLTGGDAPDEGAVALLGELGKSSVRTSFSDRARTIERRLRAHFSEVKGRSTANDAAIGAQSDVLQVFDERLERVLTNALAAADAIERQAQQQDEALASAPQPTPPPSQLAKRVAGWIRQFDATRHPTNSRLKELLVEYMRLEYAHFGELDAVRLVRAVETLHQLQVHFRGVIEGLRHDVATLEASLEQVVRCEAEIRDEDRRRQEELQGELQRREALAAELERMRADKREVEAQRAAEELSALDQARRAKLRAEQQYLEELTARVEEAARMRELQAIEASRQREEAVEEAKKTEGIRQQQARDGARRVAHRHELTLQREAAKEEQRAAAAKEQEAKEATLHAFFLNTHARLGVARDPQRAIQPTVSSAQEGMVAPLFGEEHRRLTTDKMAGYSDERVTKDPRWRLQQALIAAGLHSTGYAQNLLRLGGQRGNAFMTSELNPLRV